PAGGARRHLRLDAVGPAAARGSRGGAPGPRRRGRARTAAPGRRREYGAVAGAPCLRPLAPLARRPSPLPGARERGRARPDDRGNCSRRAARRRGERRDGVRAWYVRSPIMDAVGSSWEERRRALSGNPKPRILLIGHLRGIATISGLHVFVDEVLPELTAVLGPEGFDVEVVGAHDPP